ncbi:hypothetical protein HBE96_06655 [Clostridium sp. P21]|uniref:Uncharacterized protein n=1 Tax=Clostridium muellerianum TaxID=2716538 RepID=A0A7Y0HN78_9CLOT|nr:hypothetical protein [Clostridium muellerianum]NMM62372.1 hypothetical protein [Clostridium muellerianum]
MAKILNSEYINGMIQKVVETPLGYIINGMYYDKKTMTPKPLQMFHMYGNYLDLGMNQRLILNQGGINHNKSTGNIIANDRYDPTISYIFTTFEEGNAYGYLLKIKEYDGRINVLKEVSYAHLDNSYILFLKLRSYIGQDKRYLYCLGNCRYYDSSYKDCLFKIEKNSLTFSVIDDLGSNSWSSPIKETDTFIYYGQTSGVGYHYIKRYNKIIGSIEKIPVIERNDKNYYSTCYSELVSSSDTDFSVFSTFQDLTSHKIKIIKYHFDITQSDIKNICTEKVYDTGDIEDSITKPILTNSAHIHYEPFITTINNKSYLNIAVYERFASTPNNFPYYGIYTFEIDGITKDITYKNFLQINSCLRGFIGVRNNTFLAAASDTECYFINFEKEKFVITNTLANKPYHIGADLSENIWIINGLNEVEVYSPYVPIHVNIEYELQDYSYEGKDISTHITVAAKNYLNENTAAKLQFTINGNAVFLSNGKNNIIDTISEIGKKEIPIVIKGDGAITIDAEEVP